MAHGWGSEELANPGYGTWVWLGERGGGWGLEAGGGGLGDWRGGDWPEGLPRSAGAGPAPLAA